MKLFTIGFAQKSAEDFFTRLKVADAKRLVDVRLNNRSQLAGFAKKEDLTFFLREINHIPYVHLPLLAPTQEMLEDYRKHKGAWSDYERAFTALMATRQIEYEVDKHLLDKSCLLCSEDRPNRRQRRLVAEYLSSKWGELQIQHL
jgi:uncharacterized protein (DUF488 family)